MDPNTTPVQPPVQAPQPQVSSDIPSRQFPKKVLLIVACLVVLFVSIVGAFFLTSKNGSTKDQNINATATKVPQVPAKSNETILYAITSENRIVLTVYNLSSKKQQVFAELPKNSKRITYMTPDSIVYISETNAYDNGRAFVQYNVITKTQTFSLLADPGFYIDEYAISANKQYVAIWEISPLVTTGTLLGGKSRVYGVNLKSPTVKYLLYDEVAERSTPIHYPSAVSSSGNVLFDTFVPNSGVGWAYGASMVRIDGTLKEDIPTLKNGSYGTKFTPSPVADIVAFGGYNGSQGPGDVEKDGFRTATIFVNTIELFNLETKERVELKNLSGTDIYSRIVWSDDGKRLLFSAVPKNKPITTYSYLLSAELLTSVSLSSNDILIAGLSENNYLTGIPSNEVLALGYTYMSSVEKIMLSGVGEQAVPVQISEKSVQYITAIPGSQLPQILGVMTKNVLAEDTDPDPTEGAKNSLQLQQFRLTITPTMPPVPTITPMDQNRQNQQSNPVATMTPTVTPTPTKVIVKNPANNTNPPFTKPPTSTPPSEPQISCIDIARKQCSAQYPDNIDLKGKCIEKLIQELKQSGACNVSPLYLYGVKGKKVQIEVGVPIFASSPFASGKFNAVLSENDSFLIEGKTYTNIHFDYIPALKQFTRPTNGTVVPKKFVAKTLESYGAKLGLTKNEIKDFVNTVPTKIHDEFVFVSFFPQDISKKMLPITFSPRPDTYINYVFYLKNLGKSSVYFVTPPEFSSQVKREGFTAVEISGLIE